MANWALPEGIGRGRGTFPGHFFLKTAASNEVFCRWRPLYGKIVRRKKNLTF
jgi:hypothetical protein